MDYESCVKRFTVFIYRLKIQLDKRWNIHTKLRDCWLNWKGNITVALAYNFYQIIILTIDFRYEEAEEELRRQFGLVFEGGSSSNMGRVAVELFLLQLAKEDFVAAKKIFQEYGMQYCEQAEVVQQLK